jgi:hypothetical protein
LADPKGNVEALFDEVDAPSREHDVDPNIGSPPTELEHEVGQERFPKHRVGREAQAYPRHLLRVRHTARLASSAIRTTSAHRSA